MKRIACKFLFENKSDQIRIIQWLAVIGFIVLIALQIRLIYNVYEIEQLGFLKKEKEELKSSYEKSIVNDLIFPGGKHIIDSILKSKYAILNEIHQNPLKFTRALKEVERELLETLRKRATFDSLLDDLLKKQGLNVAEYEYALCIERLSITFDGIHYYEVLNFADKVDGIIGGKIEAIGKKNVVSGLTVTAPNPNSALVGFKFYIQKYNYVKGILFNMLPVLSLAIISILVIIIIFAVTWHNWIKQKKLNEISGDFFNSITHEFKTPLTTIGVSIKNMKADLLERFALENYRSIEVINRQVQRLDRLVNQAIEVSAFSPESAKLQSHFILSDIHDIVLDLQIKWKSQAKISLKFEEGISDAECRYDSFMLTTLLTNLVENGLKHNISDSKLVELSVSYSDLEQIIISIVDNGIGIQKLESSRIFRKFERGERSFNIEGLGLGLYLVGKIIEVHGWRLMLTDLSGEGAQFDVIIPVVK
ncbi:sensor histidine kinase [Sphingobacterium sp.]|uniref:sensor histidine kinase n=1 Tax=unclassified Sphingobacterium TaxID=2609468 RepID=UPI002FDAC593